MPDLVVISLLAALGCGLLLALVLVALRIAGRLGRIERLLEGGADSPAVLPPDLAIRNDSAEGSEAQRKEYERFLAEDESRRSLPKKEQFAAFRSWRKQRGLTWGS